MFSRPHHRRIATVLLMLDAGKLDACRCLFGGGTAMALRYGEYRESVGIDFLVSDQAGYRQLRQQLAGANGLQAIARPGCALEHTREVRTDQYGIRTVLQVEDAAIKFEIVFEARIALATPADADRLCGVSTLTPLDMAERVFIETALPAYHALTARTFRNGWDRLPPNAQGALVATVYNRGAAMAAGKSPNDPRKEMRHLRDVCVPAGDVQCMAEQFLAMRRLWPPNSEGGKGLQRRYTATAKLAVRA